MGFVEFLLIFLSMATDAFAVCLGVGATEQANGPRPRFRLSFHFGVFQFIMPVIGWLQEPPSKPTSVRLTIGWLLHCSPLWACA